MDKSKYRDGLRAVRRYIPRLEQELELLRAQADCKSAGTETNQSTIAESPADLKFEGSERLKEIMAKTGELTGVDEDEMMDSGIGSDSEPLSDMFDTDSDTDNPEKVERPLYLDQVEKFPPPRTGEVEDFEEHLRRISADPRNEKKSEFDEVDRMILQAASLLKKQRRQ